MFQRKSTGLVRSWSPWSAFFYSFLLTSVIGNGALLFASFTGPGFFPGANLPLAIIITGIAIIPVCVVYAGLGSAMPRAGGDYVFMSRILSPGIGFILTTVGDTVFLCGWVAAQGAIGAFFVLPAALSLIGYPESISFIVSPAGELLVTLLLIAIPVILISSGMRTIAGFLKVAFATSIIGSLLIVILLAHGSGAFAGSYNLAYGSNAYQGVISAAESAGFKPVQFSLFSTLVTLTLFTGLTGPANNIAPHLGEIQGATSFKLLVKVQVGAIALGAAITAGIFYLIEYGFGKTFWGALSYLFLIGKSAPSAPFFAPYFIFMSTYSAGRFAATTALLLLIFVLIGQTYANLLNALQPTKYLFAQSFDRILPERISYVNPRTHSPLVSLGIVVVASLIWASVGIINPNYTVFKLISSNVIGSIFFLMGTCVAGIVFPYRLKDVFKNSDTARYKIGGVPVLVIAGVIGLAYLLSIIAIWATVPQLGVFAGPALLTVFVVYVLVTIFYLAMRALQSRRGIPLNKIYAEIPPE